MRHRGRELPRQPRILLLPCHGGAMPRSPCPVKRGPLDGAGARAILRAMDPPKRKPAPTATQRAESAAAARKAREAEALRENLRKRKAQLRARAAPPPQRDGQERDDQERKEA
jgi:hypothetical protein